MAHHQRHAWACPKPGIEDASGHEGAGSGGVLELPPLLGRDPVAHVYGEAGAGRRQPRGKDVRLARRTADPPWRGLLLPRLKTVPELSLLGADRAEVVPVRSRLRAFQIKLQLFRVGWSGRLILGSNPT
jgi:hypothetical protein